MALETHPLTIGPAAETLARICWARPPPAPATRDAKQTAVRLEPASQTKRGTWDVHFGKSNAPARVD
eukprot:4148636-Lingulodinium_polyedra.AAC.1